MSHAPYESLNLAAHVGDDPVSVDRNRDILADTLGLSELRDRFTFAEQVHGAEVRTVAGGQVGAGSRPGVPPLPIGGTDALVTLERRVPLVMLYADCVPVVFVALRPVRGVAVVHAGWRGLLAGIVGDAAIRLASECACATADLIAYVGPHVGSCHYEVSEELMSRFSERFGTLARATGRKLDLSAVARKELKRVGMPETAVAVSDVCTVCANDRFFSFRAEGLTGRHAAIAAIL